MISELPPIDLLFQRCGRLHRHYRGLRPTGEKPSIALIETPVRPDGTPEFPKSNTRIYEEHVLLRTWLVLHGRAELRIPEDLRPCIEAVYGELPAPDEGSALRKIWDASAAQLEASRERHTREAASRYLPHPSSGARLDALTAMGREDDEALHPFFRALTRLNERTVTVICLYAGDAGLYLDSRQTRPVSLTRHPGFSDAAALLRRSCAISDRRVVEVLEAIPVPTVWRNAALLRNCRPIAFDRDGCFPLGPWRLRLCPNTGLKVEENPHA